MAPKGKRWVLAKHFEGLPKETDMRLEEFDLPKLKDGEVLLEAEFLSVDPYMRPYSASLKIGDVMLGQQVAKVIESRNADYPVGTWTIPQAGWVTHSVHNCEGLTKMPPIPEGLPRSLSLGTLGMPGLTACLGFLEVCNPKAGETVLISGASGAVGNVVGQIGKIMGCHVIGSTGADDKVAFLKEELGFDKAFNYKKSKDLDATIKSVAPDGIDIYFDCVGGEFATAAIHNMRPHGRISCCGAISSYNDDSARVKPIYTAMIVNKLKMQGYVIFEHVARYPEWLGKLVPWVKEGKIKVNEHVTQGFENMFKAFLELFTGANKGKAVVKV